MSTSLRRVYPRMLIVFELPENIQCNHHFTLIYLAKHIKIKTTLQGCRLQGDVVCFNSLLHRSIDLYLRVNNILSGEDLFSAFNVRFECVTQISNTYVLMQIKQALTKADRNSWYLKLSCTQQVKPLVHFCYCMNVSPCHWTAK